LKLDDNILLIVRDLDGILDQLLWSCLIRLLNIIIIFNFILLNCLKTEDHSF
jgi:hypothetical protein